MTDIVERALGLQHWHPARVTLTQATALVPPLAAALLLRGPGAVAILAAALLTTLIWELAFALLRHRAPTWHGIVPALIVAVMVPPGLPLWELALAVSFGSVLAELVFGGRGFGFLSAATAGLAFLVFSFPQVGLAGGEPWIAAATLPGAALLLLTGLLSWRVLLAALAGFVAVAVLTGAAWTPLVSGAGLAFGVVFLTGDPVGAASTRPGRVLYGLLVGGLVAKFDAAAGAEVAPVAVVFATLLGSIFAPLIDHLVAMAHSSARRRRLG